MLAEAHHFRVGRKIIHEKVIQHRVIQQQETLPPQDAFAQRHLGPRKDETKEMLQFLNLKVREGLKISLVAC